MTSRGAYAGQVRAQRPKTIGARIRAIRVAWGWTQDELAKRLNTDQQQISLYERDKTQPSRVMQALLADFFGIPLEALVDGKDFTIPDLPLNETEGPGSDEIQVLLPQIDTNQFMAAALPALEPRTLTLAQARELLGEIKKAGGKAWIIFEKP